MIQTQKNSEIAPFTEKEKITIALAKQSFPFFLQQVYARSFDGQLFRMADKERHPFSLGAIHYLWAKIVQENPRVCILAPRMHLKSTIINHAFSFWQLFKSEGSVDGIIVSYNDKLGAGHTIKIKEVIRNNPYCRFWIDNKPTSESVVDFQVRFDEVSRGNHCTVSPAGVFSNLRGKHPKFLICDDILTDFANSLETTQIAKINTIFAQSFESLPDEADPLIVIGTPQSYEDTLYMLRKNPGYKWFRFPAINDETGNTLWPEKFDADRLRRARRNVGETAFQVEYLLIPFLAVNSFLPIEAVEACIDSELTPFNLDEPFINPNNWPVYGGMDIGKEVHPTHISVGILAPTGDLIQIYERFLDGVDYRTQAKIVAQIVNHFGVKRFYYDATRAEFEDRVMSKKVLGKKFNKKLKAALALSMESRIFAEGEEPRLILLNDDRQTRQMVSVDRTLQSIETLEGHGDSFWSIALMIRAAEDGPVINILGDAQEMFGGRGIYKLPKNLNQYNPVEAFKVYHNAKTN